MRSVRPQHLALAAALSLAAGLAHAGSAVLHWTASNVRTGGEQLTNLAGFKLYWNCAGIGTYPSSVDVRDPAAREYTITGLPDTGTCYFVATQYDSNGVESRFTNAVHKVMGPAPNPPRERARPARPTEPPPVITSREATRPAGRTVVASDDFDRDAAGRDWAQLNRAWGSIKIIKGAVAGSAQGLEGQAARWVGRGTIGADQYSSLELASPIPFSSGYALGVICRASADTNKSRDFYELRVLAGKGPKYETQLNEIKDGVRTTLFRGDVPWSRGDRIELECARRTVRGMKSGTALDGFTITNAALSTGAPGISASGPAIVGDHWEAGSLH
jgi:hypothetical protein